MILSTIMKVSDMEIIDSRGNLTVRNFFSLDNGIRASASVLSCALTGENLAVELRYGYQKRLNGKGILSAAKNVNEHIASKPVGLSPSQ